MSTVEYLAPGDAAWTTRTTENTEDLIPDPFWRTKQVSVASKDAILLRCGVGFIKRSIDGGENWSDITPSTNPPNDAGDSPAPTVTGITFHQLDGSIASQDRFVAVARWQNTGSEWRSWLAYTANNGTSWTWKSLTVGGAPSVDSFGSNTDIGDVDVVSMAGQGNICGFRSMCRLSDTVAIVLRDQNGSPYNIEYNVMTISGNTITPGSWNDVDTTPDANEPYYGMSIVPIDATKILVAWTYFDGFSLYGGKVRAGSVSGTTITWGNEQSFIHGSVSATSIDVAVLSTSHAVVAYSMADNSIRARVISISGTSLTVNSEYTVESTNSAGLRVSICPLDDTYSVICYNNSGGNSNIGMAKVATRSSTALSFGSAYQFSTTSKAAIWFRCVSLSSTLFVVGFTQKEGAFNYRANSTAGTVSGSTITFGSPTPLDALDHDSGDVISIDTINGDNFLFSRQRSSADDQFTVGSVSGTTITYSTIITNTGVSSQLGHVLSVISGSQAVLAFYKDESGPPDRIGAYVVNYTAGLSYGKSLGVSVGKGAGNRAWTTMWAESGVLSLLDITLPGLTINASYEVGAATESQMTNKTWIAYPYGIYGSDDAVVIFGRMDAPQGLSSPEHIIYTANAGSSFSSIENGWVGNHCGSVVYLYTGDLYAIRNDGASTRLYIGSLVSALVMKSILPLPAGVDPHGMAVDPYNLNLVACSNVPGTVMVAQSSSPYFNWNDFTYDHQTSEGVNALAIL